MKPTNEEVYQALITVREFCSNNKECDSCPLDLGGCGLLRKAPEDWRIGTLEYWKSFE